MFTGHILGTPGSLIVDECDEAAPWARHLYSSYYLAADDANTDGDRKPDIWIIVKKENQE